MGIKHVAIFVALLISVSSASGQEYSIRANRGLNLRAAPSLNAEIAGTVRTGDILLVIGHNERWLRVRRPGAEAWLANWVNFSRVEQTQTQTETAAEIDNCCFVDRQCATDQQWINGYWAYQHGQCAAPAQMPAETSAQPAASETGVIDNCCFAGWQCNSDQEWVNGYHAYQNNQCDAPPSASRRSATNADSCCQLGWNCTIDEDRTFARWWFDDHNGHCYIPIQVSFDGLIVEGTRPIVDRVIRSLNLLKTKAPHWYAYTRNALIKIRESDELVGTGVLGRTFNVVYNPYITDDLWKAGVFAHEACHVYRLYYGTYHYETTEQQITEEAVCNFVQMLAYNDIDPQNPYRAGMEASIVDYYSQGYQYDVEGAARVERDRAQAL